MKTYLKNIFWLLAAMICITSCDQEEVTDVNNVITTDGKIPVRTEIIVDGVITRASSEAGYTTGDGLYDIGDDVTVTATANEGYELISFYDKKDPTKNLGSSHTLKAKVPTTFKAEFGRKHTITVTASPTEGGTVSGGGKYGYGKSCTISAIANAGYAFDGWYEGSTKISSETNYTFTVSSSRTITGKFKLPKYILVGSRGYIISPTKIQQVGTNTWNAIAYGNGKFVAVGNDGWITSSSDGETWSTPKQIGVADNNPWNDIIYAGGKFVAVGTLALAYSAVSIDGVNWTLSSMISKECQFIGVTYLNKTFIAADKKGWIWESTDGLSWQKSQQVTTSTIMDINFLNGIIMITDASYRIWISSDGKTWSNSKTSFTCYTSAYGNGKFVIMGNLGYIITSTDGVNWSSKIQVNPLTTGGNFIWNKVRYINGNFVAVGYGSYIATSANGITWNTEQAIPYTYTVFMDFCAMQ